MVRGVDCLSEIFLAFTVQPNLQDLKIIWSGQIDFG